MIIAGDIGLVLLQSWVLVLRIFWYDVILSIKIWVSISSEYRSQLTLRYKSSKLVSKVISVGIGPESWLLLSDSPVNSVRLPISAGIDPDSLLFPKLRYVKFVRFPIFGGIGPFRFLLRRWSWIILPSTSQWTPDQLLTQQGSSLLQPICTSCPASTVGVIIKCH